MNRRSAIILFSKVPQISRDNPADPFAALPWDDLDALFTAFLGDVIQNVCQIPDVDVLLYRNPNELSDDFLAPFRDRLRFRDMNDAPFAVQVQRAIEETFHDHYDRVLVLLENHPAMGTRVLRRALGILTHDDDCIVYAPTTDGHCLMIGMKMNHGWIFENTTSDPVIKPYALMEKLCSVDTQVYLLPPTYMLDSSTSLGRLHTELGEREGRELDFPKRTFEMFRALDKKYRFTKAPAR